MSQVLGTNEHHDNEAVQNGQHEGPLHVEQLQPGQMGPIRIVHKDDALATIILV